jgi:hypothetical protein
VNNLNFTLTNLQRTNKDIAKYLYPHIVETSADLNINIEAAFCLLASLLSKSLQSYRPNVNSLKYSYGFERYQQVYNRMTAFYNRLLANEISNISNLEYEMNNSNSNFNYNSNNSPNHQILQQFNYKLQFEQFHARNLADIKRLIELYGINFVLNQFNAYMTRVREAYIRAKSTQLIKERLAPLLNAFYPPQSKDKSFYIKNSWQAVSNDMRKSPLFEQFIIKTDTKDTNNKNNANQCLPWYENKIFDSFEKDSSKKEQNNNNNESADADEKNKNKNLLFPFELFESEECGLYYDKYVLDLVDDLRLSEKRSTLLELLQTNAIKNNIQPGMSWKEASVFVIGRECYESLSDECRSTVYRQFQKELIKNATLNYREALCENVDYFVRKRTTLQNLNNDDLNEILSNFKDDIRHQRLDRLPDERRSILLRHLAFILGKTKAKLADTHCPCGSVCVDAIIDKYLNNKIEQIESERLDRSLSLSPSPLPTRRQNNTLNLILIGEKTSCDQVLNQFEDEFKDLEYNFDGSNLNKNNKNNNENSFNYKLNFKFMNEINYDSDMLTSQTVHAIFCCLPNDEHATVDHFHNLEKSLSKMIFSNQKSYPFIVYTNHSHQLSTLYDIADKIKIISNR